MSGTVSTNNFTEEEKVLLLKIFKVNLPQGVTRERIDAAFGKLQAKLKKAQESNKNFINGGEFAELATVIVDSANSTPSPFNQFNANQLETVAQDLKKTLNAIPWKNFALTTAKCGVFVLGFTPQSLAAEIVVAVGLQLLMRVRFGNLFQGGGAAIHVLLQNLNKTDIREMAQETAKGAAMAVMTVVEALTKTPSEAIIQVAGAASKFFSAFSTALSSLAGKAQFHVKIPEQADEEQDSIQRSTAPTPFHLTLTPFNEK